MIKIENGWCVVEGSINDVKEEFRIFLHAIQYYDNTVLLNELINVLEEELEKCNEQS